MATDGAALYAEAARHHFTPKTKRLTLSTPYALGVARTRLHQVISPTVASGDDHNVEILPEGSLQNVRTEDIPVALAGLSAPAVIVVKSGDPAVEAAAVRLLDILRYCKDQLSQVESSDGRWRHVYVPRAAALE